MSGEEAEEIGESETGWQRGRSGDAMIYVQGAIAAFTSTRVSYRGNASVGSSMTYYGYEPERELAHWLHNHTKSAIELESRQYNPPVRNATMRSKYRRSFAVYMARRIAMRLFDLAETLDDTGRGSGAEVMVVKNAKLDDYFESLGCAAPRVSKRRFIQDGAESGDNAGGKVSLHRPVSEQAGPLRLAGQ